MVPPLVSVVVLEVAVQAEVVAVVVVEVVVIAAESLIKKVFKIS